MSIGKSSWKPFQADRIRVVTASMCPLACPITVSNSSLSIAMHVGKGSSVPATVEQILQINSLQFLKLSQIPVIIAIAIIIKTKEYLNKKKLLTFLV